MIRAVRGWFLYTGGHNVGGAYKTVYWETIPKIVTNHNRELTGPRFTTSMV
jgi:hypothetical protein